MTSSTLLRRLGAAGLAAVAAGALSSGPAVPAAAAGPTIGVSAPQYESPGGTVPTIVTVHGVPTGYTAAITATGTDGAVATCVDGVWHNRARATASRKCYLRLPARTGSYNVQGSATLSKNGATTLRATGVGRRAVLGNGYASPAPLPLDRIRQIERCHNSSHLVQLTFDDGGSPAQVTAILDTLKRNRVKGRFFFRGDWAARNPTLLGRLKAEGHVVGNHTYDHPALSKTSGGGVLDQITRGTQATGAPKLLRPPYAAGALTTRLEGLAAQKGYRLCRWTTDTYDWEGPSAAVMAERVRVGDYRTPPVQAGGNILMHGTAHNTAYGLQQIIDAVRARGLQLEPLR